MLGSNRITSYQNSFKGVEGPSERSQESVKIHDYTHQLQDLDYALEPAAEPNHSYMTGQGKGVKVGDRILLHHDGAIYTYRVKTIDYYASPSDMWAALLLNENPD